MNITGRRSFFLGRVSCFSSAVPSLISGRGSRTESAEAVPVCRLSCAAFKAGMLLKGTPAEPSSSHFPVFLSLIDPLGGDFAWARTLCKRDL